VVAYYFDLFHILLARSQYEEVTKHTSQHVVLDEISKSSTPPISYNVHAATTSTSTAITQTTSWKQDIVPQTTSTITTPSVTATPYPASQWATPNEVLLIFKTGASTIWRRMPLHILTTLQHNTIPHHVLYSDLSETLTPSLTSIDILQNSSSIIQTHDPAALAAYQDQQSPNHINTYREHSRLPGDEPPDNYAGHHPGWLLDKYKFLPMLSHAAQNWKGMKWYVYIEDDTFIFWENVLAYLESLDEEKVAYYGAYSGEGEDTFAQGGSGIAFSGALVKKLFGDEGEGNGPTLEMYGNETSKSCCGDIMLGKVLRDYGIKVNEGGYGKVGWRPEPMWKTGFEKQKWCERVFTFHHLHQRDLVMLSELERKVKEDAGVSSSLPFFLFLDLLIWAMLT
jgi:hypothetical protein